jgi:hypothetical protein
MTGAATGAGTGTSRHPEMPTATTATRDSEPARRPNLMRAMSVLPPDWTRPGVAMFHTGSAEVAGHSDRCHSWGVIEGLGFAGPPEPASGVQGDGCLVRGGHPECETRSLPFSRPGGDGLDESDAEPAPARLGSDEHRDELRPRIGRIPGSSDKSGRDPEPLPGALGDEGDGIHSRSAALGALAPHVVGERLLPRERRAERHRRIGQSAQAKDSQARSLVGADSPDRRWPHGMSEPPFTWTVWPVMCPASSLARNTAIPAMSPGCAMRPSGTALAITASSSSLLP